MKPQIPLTFIIPSYGRQQKLERAIDSILLQDVWPEEIIVVDDASPEALTLPEKLAVTNLVKLVRQPENGGPAKARNTGLLAARTHWVSFLDSDDCLMPSTLHLRWEFVQNAEIQNHRKGNTVYGCGWLDVLPEGRILRQRIPFPAAAVSEFFRGCWFAPGSCIILNRVEIMSRAGGPDDYLRRLEDYEWFLRIGLAGFDLQVQPIAGALVERGNNTSLEAVRIATATIRQRIAQLTQDRRLRRTANAYLFYECAASAWRERKLLRFISFMMASLITRPRLSLSPLPGWHLSPPQQPVSKRV